MATSASEILEKRRASGVTGLGDVFRTLEYYPAPTDEIAEQQVVKIMPEEFPTVEVKEDYTFPSLAEVAKAAGEKDDPKDMKNGRTAVEKFVQDFPKKVNQYKKKISKNPVLGKRGWETAKTVWQNAMNDKTEETIREDREKILAGDDMDGVEGAIAKVGGFASKVFTPRQREALLEGRDPTWKDYVGDVVEDGLMMVPAGKFSKVIGLVPKAGSKLLGNKVVTNVFGNAVAPISSEAMDAIMRGEDDPNTERQDFSLGDALMGAATNIGVNYGLVRNFGGGGRVASGELTRSAQGGFMGKAREAVQNFGKSRVERGLPAPTTKFGKVVDFAEQAAPTFIVNKYGKDSDANYALGAVGGIGGLLSPEIGKLPEEVKKFRDEEKQEMRDRKTKSKISKVIEVKELTPKDEKYLKLIAEDPSLTQFGYAPDNDDFKLWLLTRGNELLRGTDAHRPTWSIVTK